ncbi:MAG: cytochrome b [Pseudomonas sp.]|nr:cytochrome b [Pseudomonas sp.]
MIASSSSPAVSCYSRPALFFHWVLAALIPFQIGLGWYMLSIEGSPGSVLYFTLHVSLGLTAAVLIALRLLWRMRHRPHALPPTIPRWQAKAAELTHVSMYVFLLMMPVTGYLGAAFGGDPIAYFGIAPPLWATANDVLKEQLFTVHGIIAWALVALIVLHVGGAFKHLLIDKDGVFGRMWPWQS